MNKQMSILLIFIILSYYCNALEPPHYDYISSSISYKSNFINNLKDNDFDKFNTLNSNIFNSEISLSYKCSGLRYGLVYEFLNYRDTKILKTENEKYKFDNLVKNDFIKLKVDLIGLPFFFNKILAVGFSTGIGYNPNRKLIFDNIEEYDEILNHINIKKQYNYNINYKVELNFFTGHILRLSKYNSHSEHLLYLFAGLDLEFLYNSIIYNNFNYNFKIGLEYILGKSNLPFCPEYKYCNNEF